MAFWCWWCGGAGVRGCEGAGGVEPVHWRVGVVGGAPVVVAKMTSYSTVVTRRLGCQLSLRLMSPGALAS